MKKVSVVMPTYKGEAMLAKAIRSILSQTYKNVELIVVDDNGLGTLEQKKTESIVEKFDDDRIIYVAHAKNCNGAVARNTGLKKATGDYVCFHDDDDLMLPNRIEKCVKILDEDEKIGGVLMDVLCCDERMTPIRIVKIREEGDCTRNLFIDGMFLGSGSNIFVRRKIAEKIGGFDTSFARHQDVEFMIRFYEVSKSKSANEIGIIKSKNGIINIPNYPKFKKNEEQFINKFKSNIERLGRADRDKFYSDVAYWIKISKALYDGDMSGLKNKDKIMVVISRTNFDKKKMFAFLVRELRKNRAKKLRIPDGVIRFLEEYR